MTNLEDLQSPRDFFERSFDLSDEQLDALVVMILERLKRKDGKAMSASERGYHFGLCLTDMTEGFTKSVAEAELLVKAAFRVGEDVIDLIHGRPWDKDPAAIAINWLEDYIEEHQEGLA